MTASSRPRAASRFLLVAVWTPVVLVAVGIAVQLILLPQMPSTIATHWNAAGVADGFAPSWVQPLATAGLGLGVPLLLALTALPGLRRGDAGPTYRLLGAVSASTSTLITVALTGTFVAQMGAEPSVDAPSVWPTLLAAFAAAIVVGVAAWFLQPRQAARNVTSAPAPGMALAPAEQAVWFGVASMGRGATIALAATCVALAATAVIIWLAGADLLLSVVFTALTVFVLLLTATTCVFQARIDATGLTVASSLGVPRFHVPIDDIRTVAVSDVSPLGEFGGYGIRKTVGAFGVVLRRGEAITVVRRNGNRFVVTVDDARTGASLLEALSSRDSGTIAV